jgi:hypothetical protein
MLLMRVMVRVLGVEMRLGIERVLVMMVGLMVTRVLLNPAA